MDPDMTVTALWSAVILSGLYHGVNPGMGWPLAVSAALFEGRGKALPKALAMLAGGHFIAMLAMLLPFSLVSVLVTYERQITAGAALLVIAMGVYLLINRRHPRFLARVHPSRLALWSFLAAIAHGAGLMLVPIYLGLCAVPLEGGHAAAASWPWQSISNSDCVLYLKHGSTSMWPGRPVWLWSVSSVCCRPMFCRTAKMCCAQVLFALRSNRFGALPRPASWTPPRYLAQAERLCLPSLDSKYSRYRLRSR